jgi:ABC-type transport system involved in Fe-S cluster assembly fused permease/ATPase subunit
MNISSTVFTEIRFWLLIVFSVILPICIYGVLMVKRAISRIVVLFFGITLVTIAGLDFYLLHSLAGEIKRTLTVDDAVLIDEISFALYVLPALFAGIGVNVVSHILLSHLVEAEKRFKQENENK